MMSSTQSGHIWQQHTKFPTLCPVLNVKKVEGFSSKKRQMDHIQNCEELGGEEHKEIWL